MDEIKKESIMLRTLLKKDVYDRLELFAKSLATGMNKWDFGVAIERLLDFAEFSEDISALDSRITDIEMTVLQQKAEPKKVDSDEDLLLGNKHGKKNGKN